MEGYSKNDNTDETDNSFRYEVYSTVIRAGKRTYFFDVKSTRNEELYLTITESKKRFENDGSYFYEKHKIFLYREDFDKFCDCLQEIFDYIKTAQPEPAPRIAEEDELEEVAVKNFSGLDFDDLNK